MSILSNGQSAMKKVEEEVARSRANGSSLAMEECIRRILDRSGVEAAIRKTNSIREEFEKNITSYRDEAAMAQARAEFFHKRLQELEELRHQLSKLT